MTSLEETNNIVARAQRAISRAKALSVATDGHPGREGAEDAAPSSSTCPLTEGSCTLPSTSSSLLHDSTNTLACLSISSLSDDTDSTSHVPIDEGCVSPVAPDTDQPSPHASSLLGHIEPAVLQPVYYVARRLELLQLQQSQTLQQLIQLRLEQLKLRQQQLSALQGLLRSEAATLDESSLQVTVVQRALHLLSTSQCELDLAASSLRVNVTVQQVAATAESVSRADSRADEVSKVARHLLQVLRDNPRPSRSEDLPAGASDEQLDALPTHEIAAGSVLLGELCCICLAHFEQGHVVKSLACLHHFHPGCLDEWLRIQASCPLCKTQLSDE